MDHDVMLTTERLTLRPLAETDAGALFAAYGDAEAMRFWHTPPHRSAEETRALIRRLLAGPDRSWVLVPRGQAEAIGHVYYLGNDGPPGMGYILARPHWGRGLMGEAVAAALAHGFGALDLDRVELWIDGANRASERLALRAGFRRQGAFPQRGRDGAFRETQVYGLRRAEWRGAPDATPRAYGIRPVLPVTDVAATAAWYRDRLGFRVTFMVGEPASHAGVAMAEWTNGGAQIHLERRSGAAIGAVALYVVVGDSIDRLHAAFAANGVEIVEPPADRPWGARTFAIRDCNGYTLSFNTMP